MPKFETGDRVKLKNMKVNLGPGRHDVPPSAVRCEWSVDGSEISGHDDFPEEVLEKDPPEWPGATRTGES